jgi:hypothetical protein
MLGLARVDMMWTDCPACVATRTRQLQMFAKPFNRWCLRGYQFRSPWKVAAKLYIPVCSIYLHLKNFQQRRLAREDKREPPNLPKL